MKKIFLTSVILLNSLLTFPKSEKELKEFKTIEEFITKLEYQDDLKVGGNLERVFVQYEISELGELRIIDMKSTNILFEEYIFNQMNSIRITDTTDTSGVLIVKFILR